jgi:hypothetical protein
MIFLYIWLIGIISGVITTVVNPGIRTLQAVCTNMLFYQMTVTLTISGLTGFIGHVFKSDMVAEQIGWDKGSPFQKELGYSELGYAIAGFLCIWFQPDFWLAAIVLTSPLYLLAGINHVWEMIVKKNYAPHNTWTIIPDFIMPISWIVLYILMKN